MESRKLREKLHSLIDTSSSDKLEEIYDYFREDKYSDDFKMILDKEYEQYQKDREVISHEDVNKSIEDLLHSKK